MKKKKGFTLIELIIVLAILAALILIMSVISNGFIKNSQKVQCIAQRALILRQYQSYSVSKEDVKLTDLIANKDKLYFSEKPRCSLNGYYVAAVENKIAKIYCSEHDEHFNFPLFSEDLSANLKMLNAWVKDLSREDQIRFGFDKKQDNDQLRVFLLEQVYGGVWPKVSDQSLKFINIESADPYYIMPFIKDPNDPSGPIILYASASINADWYTNLIYNHENGQWYAAKNRNSGISITIGWEKVKQKILSTSWEPVTLEEE